MIAFLFNTGWTELLIVALVAVMVFGRDLPQVAAKAFVQLQKLRRGVTEVWRETGISEEMRKLQREMEENERRARAPFQEARRIQAELRRDVTRRGAAAGDGDASEGDATDQGRDDAPPIGSPVPGTVSVGDEDRDRADARDAGMADARDAGTNDARDAGTNDDPDVAPTPGGEPERREGDAR